MLWTVIQRGMGQNVTITLKIYVFRFPMFFLKNTLATLNVNIDSSYFLPNLSTCNTERLCSYVLVELLCLFLYLVTKE